VSQYSLGAADVVTTPGNCSCRARADKNCGVESFLSRGREICTSICCRDLSLYSRTVHSLHWCWKSQRSIKWKASLLIKSACLLKVTANSGLFFAEWKTQTPCGQKSQILNWALFHVFLRLNRHNFVKRP